MHVNISPPIIRTMMPTWSSHQVGLRPATSLKKNLWHTCFPANFAKLQRTPFSQNISGGCFCYLKLQAISTETSEMILKRKCSHKLNDPHTSATSCWSILKTLYNVKKILLIPPISINNMLISNFKEKANHFNAFFASQCTPIPNDSTLHL